MNEGHFATRQDLHHYTTMENSEEHTNTCGTPCRGPSWKKDSKYSESNIRDAVPPQKPTIKILNSPLLQVQIEFKNR